MREVSAARGCEGQGRVSLWTAWLWPESCVEPLGGDTAPQKDRAARLHASAGHTERSWAGSGRPCFSLLRDPPFSPPPTLGWCAGPWAGDPRPAWLLPLTSFGIWEDHSTPLCLSFHTCKMAIITSCSLCGSIVRLSASNNYW